MSAFRLLVPSAVLMVLALCASHCALPSEGSPDRTGQASAAIVGGESDAADPAVVLVALQSSTGGGTCTGVVVSPHVIVTAAHCLDPRVAGAGLEPYYVYLGQDLQSKSELAKKANFVRIAEVHFDPSFDPTSLSPTHDVGIVVTTAPLAMTPLPMNRVPLGAEMVGRSVRMVGYGIADTSPDAAPDTLSSKHDVAVAVAGVDAEHLTFDDHRHATCEGDSGGPSLMKRDDGSEAIVGIHSFAIGGGCGSGTAYDTRIDVYAASYIDGFIQKHDPNFPLDLDAGVAPIVKAEQDAATSADSSAAPMQTETSSCSLGAARATSLTPRGLLAFGVLLASMILRRRRVAANVRVVRSGAVLIGMVVGCELAVACGGSDDTTTPSPSSDASPGPADPVVLDAGTDARADTVLDASGVDASGKDASDAAPPGWLPTALPSLALWLVGDTGLGPGSVWADQSGQGNDVAPLVTATAKGVAVPSMLNGHGVIEFAADGTQPSDQSGFVGIPKNAPMAGDFLVLAVCQSVTANRAQIFLTVPSNGGVAVPIGNVSAFGTSAFFGVNSTTFEAGLLLAGNGVFAYPSAGHFADLKPHVVGMRRSAAGFAILQDEDEPIHLASAGDVGDEFVVGGPFHGYIAELVVNAGSTSNADADKLRQYFKAKYALTF